MSNRGDTSPEPHRNAKLDPDLGQRLAVLVQAAVIHPGSVVLGNELRVIAAFWLKSFWARLGSFTRGLKDHGT